MNTNVLRRSRALAFRACTLLELLIVVVVLGLLVAFQAPVICRTKPPVQLVQCLSNCRQIALASMLYANEGDGAYVFAGRAMSPYPDPSSWPMQLLPYLGCDTNTQPKVYLCPSERGSAPSWRFQVHYQGNRMLLSDSSAQETPVYRSQVRNPAIYWLFSDKDPASFATVKPAGMANPVLASWNIPPGSFGYRRHSGGMCAAAADGHVDWLRMPPYQPGRPSPLNFEELGDCANGQNPASSWQDSTVSVRVKLYSRYNMTGF